MEAALATTTTEVFGALLQPRPRPVQAAPLSPERLQQLADQAWKLEPVQPHERKGLLRDQAAMLVDRLLVEVARSSGAIDVAIGEGLAALCAGDGPMRLGYSGIGDYARENLSIAGRTAFELKARARELRSRPLLRDAVRAGEISVKKADAIMKVAVGEAEARWVARAEKEGVRELKAAVKGNDAGLEEREEERWERFTLELGPEARAISDEALELAGRMLGQASPRWQRVEGICQEFLGEHPAPVLEHQEETPAEWRECLRAFLGESQPPMDLRIWLAREYQRWSFLHQLDPIAAPGAGVDDLTRARKIDARLRELAGMRKGWDELVGHLSLLVVNSGLWRDMKFADVDHYAAERLGMSGKAMKKRAWLERRMWELPPIRRAMREGRIGYEKALLVARCRDRGYVEAWIAKAEELTCIQLRRAVEADDERTMCARGRLALALPREVSELFQEACRSVRAVAKDFISADDAWVVMCAHFIETWKEVLKTRKTSSRRVRERDGGWCSVPGCSRAAAHAHHVKFRSHLGGEEDENKTPVCLAHHLHGIHKGYVRVHGRAPDQLAWELGEED